VFLSNFSIRQPITTVAIIVVLMCMGLLAINNLRVNQLPDVLEPTMAITVPYPGASPETVEREVINRIEKPLQSIPQVRQISSTASESSAQIIINFNFGKDLVEAADEIRNAIGSVRYKLPLEMREPVLSRFDPTMQPVMQLSLTSETQSLAEISRLAEDDLADRFRGVDGVATVDVNGSLRRELSVLLHAQKLREYNISVADVTNALRQQNTTAPVGNVKGELEDRGIRLVGRIQDPAGFNDIVLRRNGDEMVRLGQVATVQDGFAEQTSYSLRNGLPNVGIAISRSRDASTVSIAEDTRVLVDEIQKELPAGTTLSVVQDGGRDASISLDHVIEALIFGAMLTVLVVYAFLNSWRSTLITALSLPTSAIAAFIAVWLAGYTLNFMTLLGLSLAVGVLIDDAIVVRENIVRHLESGQDRITAAREGTAEIGLAVAATTFSIMAVFVPVAFMGGIAGEWFRPFAVTVATSVMVSLFISFTLDPMLSAYWGDPPGHGQRARRGLGALLARFNHWFDSLADRYGRVIAWALHHRKWMALIAVASLVGALYVQYAVGRSDFLPRSDGNMIAVLINTPSSASLGYSQLKVEAAAALARELPETRATNATVNAGGGRIYVDIGPSPERQRTASGIAEDLRDRLESLVGGEFIVLDDLNNDGQKPVQIQFYGTDMQRLTDITNGYLKTLATVPGAVDVGLSEREPKDELRIELDRGLANQLGISVDDAAQALRVAFAGVEVGDWVDPTGETRDVAVRLAPEDRVNAANIERLPVAVGGGNALVPLEQIAHITMDKGPASISHLDTKRTITVSANVENRGSGEVTADAEALAEQIEFPSGFGVTLGGSSADQQEIFAEMGIALVMGIAVMYLVLVIQFGSFTAPLPVMISLPLSLIGVVLALLATGGSLNLMSLIGIIMLMGLVAKNAILLLDATRKEEASGVDREEALMHAGRRRLRPILMTTFALVAGMMPVAIGLGEGSEFYSPMAVAIIGGVITSTLLTLLVIPSFYDSIEVSRERMLAKFHRRSEHGNVLVAFLATFVEAILTLVFLRFLFRLLARLFGHKNPHPAP
jgi:HAE1 family hydrophobic/amphiphilic exporter-1